MVLEERGNCQSFRSHISIGVFNWGEIKKKKKKHSAGIFLIDNPVPCSVGLLSDSLNSIEPRCICLHLPPSQTYMENTTRLTMFIYVFIIILVLLYAAEWMRRASMCVTWQNSSDSSQFFANCVFWGDGWLQGIHWVLWKLTMSSSAKTPARVTLLREQVRSRVLVASRQTTSRRTRTTSYQYSRVLYCDARKPLSVSD